jgi:myo-inositol-1(or 4)-monophosphatase
MDAPELQKRRAVAEEAARAAGAVHLRYYGRVVERQVKGWRRDFVTRVDLEAQDAVKQIIARNFPGEPVIGEEDEDAFALARDTMQGICWLTDPLDGTAEFLHTSTPFCSVVSCVAGGEPIAAAVYHSHAGQLFSAAARLGAVLDGRPMRVSERTELSEALFVASFTASSAQRARLFADWLEAVMPAVGAYRMLGSSALCAASVAAGRIDISSALCAASVAAGRIDIYASTPEPAAVPPLPGAQQRPQPWETPAYVLLVREAGGVVASTNGGPADLLGFNVYAASASLLEQYFSLTS